jgi:hypothetical protein
MKIYECAPKKDTKRLTVLTTALFIGAVVMLGVTFAFKDIPYRWAFQLIGLGMLTIGIFYLTRYIKRSFIYALVKTDNGTDLTVTEINGRHVITVCRVAVENIEEIYTACPTDSLETKEAMSKAKSNKRKFFNYTVDMFGDKCIFILVTECNEPISLKLSYDEGLMEALSTRSEATEQ